MVWKEVMRLLEDPHIIQDELNRRLVVAKNADPFKQREDQLRRDHEPPRKGMDRLLIAYQEGLVSPQIDFVAACQNSASKIRRFRPNCSRWKRPPVIKPNICGSSRRSAISIHGCGHGRKRWTCPSARRSTAAGERDPRRSGNDHDSALDPDAEPHAGSERSAEAGSHT